jgi:toxin ParE1/3/4
LSRQIIIDPAADRDIDEQLAYLADRSVDVAVRYLEATEQTFEFLALTPGIGAEFPHDHPRLAGVRKWPINGFENYLAFYITDEESIRIIRILHGARDVERILRAEE